MVPKWITIHELAAICRDEIAAGREHLPVMIQHVHNGITFAEPVIIAGVTQPELENMMWIIGSGEHHSA